MRDLEIRGAGNILGPEQSGHIAAIGYELYCRLLDTAVRRLRTKLEKGARPTLCEPPEGPSRQSQPGPLSLSDRPPVHLELEVPAYIPRSYIESDRQRIEIYRRLARCTTREELDQLQRDIHDAFGPCPPAVHTLLELAEIRVLAHPLRIRTIRQAPPDLIFTFDELARIEPLLNNSPGSARMADAHTVHLRLSPAYFEPKTLVSVLRRMLQAPAAAPALETS
jgi:transcription-repair coupling factor (superfamily II helicase)